MHDFTGSEHGIGTDWCFWGQNITAYLPKHYHLITKTFTTIAKTKPKHLRLFQKPLRQNPNHLRVFVYFLNSPSKFTRHFIPTM